MGLGDIQKDWGRDDNGMLQDPRPD